MTIHVQCACGAKLNVADAAAGKRGTCPGCGGSITIPAASGVAQPSAPQMPPPDVGTPSDPRFYNPLQAGPLPAAPPPTDPGFPPGSPPGSHPGAAWGNPQGWPQGVPSAGGYAPQPGSMPGAFGQQPQAWDSYPQGPTFGAAPAAPQKAFQGKRSKATPNWMWSVAGVVAVAVAVAVSAAVRYSIRNAFRAELGNLSWQVYHSPQGRYRVDMPGQPKQNARPTATAAGMVQLHCEAVEPSKDMCFMVMYTDLPTTFGPLNPDDVLNGAVQGLSSEYRTRGSSLVECEGFPGREVYYDAADPLGQAIHGRVRLFMVKQRLYQVHYLGRPGTDNHPDVGRFLDSFDPD